MLKTYVVSALAALAVGLSAGSPAGASAPQRAIHLVYHSDTRGYYRPCG